MGLDFPGDRSAPAAPLGTSQAGETVAGVIERSLPVPASAHRAVVVENERLRRALLDIVALRHREMWEGTRAMAAVNVAEEALSDSPGGAS